MSNMISKIEDLRELEQRGEERCTMNDELRNLAPAMLAALSMIQEGDAKNLSWVAELGGAVDGRSEENIGC